MNRENLGTNLSTFIYARFINRNESDIIFGSRFQNEIVLKRVTNDKLEEEIKNVKEKLLTTFIDLIDWSSHTS